MKNLSRWNGLFDAADRISPARIALQAASSPGGGGNLPVSPVAIVAPGLAESPNVASANAGDALAVLTGTGGSNQSASIVVGNIPATPSGYEEFEIHLRTDPVTGTGYEISWAYNHNYILIATWNGGGVVGSGAYTTLFFDSGPQYAIAPGDTLTASIQGNLITMYTNGVQVAQITDNNNTFSTGNPGFGFDAGASGQYAISSFSASSSGSNPTPPVKSDPTDQSDNPPSIVPPHPRQRPQLQHHCLGAKPTSIPPTKFRSELSGPRRGVWRQPGCDAKPVQCPRAKSESCRNI